MPETVGGDFIFEGVGHFNPACVFRQVEAEHDVDQVLVLVIAGAFGRTDVGNNQAIDSFGVVEGKLHHGFPAHGVAKQVGFIQVVRIQKLKQVVAHGFIAEYRAVPRTAVVSLIDNKHTVFLSQFRCNGNKIVRHAKQAVEDDQGLS